MGDFDAMADEIYAERVRRAREMSPEQKLVAGEELFAYACRITAEGIAAQFPDTTPEQRLEILRARLALRKRMERAPRPA